MLSRNYPNPALPTLGIWVERLVRAAAAVAEPHVVAPVPAVPPGLSGFGRTRYRDVPRTRVADGVTIEHPRVPAGPGYLLHRWEARMMYPFIRRVADRLHRARPFDLIHAHFIYPDGVIAAGLGRRYGVPVVSTEHAPWMPWLADYPSVRRQVVRALPAIDAITVASEPLRRSIVDAVGPDVRIENLSLMVDDQVFRAPAPGERWEPDRLLFVGVVRRVKGLDVLVRALPALLAWRPGLTLTVVGEPYHAAYRRDELEVRKLVGSLGLDERVRFVGQRTPAEVAAEMRRSAVLVVPSRRESFSSVTIEALSSGTPVVATRCGGPEAIVTPANGRLVPVDDPAALAAAIHDVLGARERFDRAALHRAAIDRFGPTVVASRLNAIYHAVLERAAERPRSAA